MADFANDTANDDIRGRLAGAFLKHAPRGTDIAAVEQHDATYKAVSALVDEKLAEYAELEAPRKTEVDADDDQLVYVSRTNGVFYLSVDVDYDDFGEVLSERERYVLRALLRLAIDRLDRAEGVSR